MPGRVLGDGERLEGVAGEGGEDGVAVGVGVGAGPSQGDEQFVDGGAGLDLEEGLPARAARAIRPMAARAGAASERGTTGRSGSM